MNTITIKPLTAELSADYLDFFDNRAFTDDKALHPHSLNEYAKTQSKMATLLWKDMP